MRISDWSSDVCSSDLLWDWLPPATVANLVTKKIVMPPAQTSCQIPAEVRQASGEMMIGNLNAFGPEASFSYPPKPAGNAEWNIDWTAKARFRSHTTLMIGDDSGGMGARAGGDYAPSEQPRQNKCKRPFGLPRSPRHCLKKG